MAVTGCNVPAMLNLVLMIPQPHVQVKRLHRAWAGDMLFPTKAETHAGESPSSTPTKQPQHTLK